MDFSKYKVTFDRLLNWRPWSNRNVCRNIWVENDARASLIASQGPICYTNTLPLAPVPLVSSEVESRSLPNEHELDSKVQYEARKLREILPQVSEATIYDLLQQHSTAQTAVNAYYENRATE